MSTIQGVTQNGISFTFLYVNIDLFVLRYVSKPFAPVTVLDYEGGELLNRIADPANPYKKGWIRSEYQN